MLRARHLTVLALLASTPAVAADLVYMARLDSAGTVIEEHSLRCDATSRCMLVFDEASETWRQALSIELSADAQGVTLIGRSAGTEAASLLVGRGHLPIGPGGGVATVTLRPQVPAGPRLRVGGDAFPAGFGPFIVGLQPLQR